MSIHTGDYLTTYEMVIDGQLVTASSGKTFESTNPYTGQAWATVPDGDTADVDRAVAAARSAFERGWGQTTGTERARLIRKLADLLVRDADRLAALETRDNG